MTANSIRFKQFTALVVSCAALAAVAAPRHIRPPAAQSYGHTLEEWAAFWCQSKAPFLRPDPGAETQCSFGQSGPVEFLADGTPSSNLDEFHTNLRECVVPEGQALFFPIHYTFVFSTPDFPVTEDELRARSSLYLSYNTNRQCEIDGRPIEDLERYRRQTPAFSFPWNGGGDIPAGPAVGVADGYWILLAPLAAGAHTIHIVSGAPGSDDYIDLLIRLTVVPASEYVPPNPGAD